MAIPVHLISGPLGVGKTTAIARLLASKPAHEPWLVVLNEFTDTGLDTLTLAAAAQGAYDLRTIAGGCLCCTGEADFRQQLSSLLAQPPTHWPARILIEPSGIGHPSAVIEELRLFERSGALQLQSVVALLDGLRWSEAMPSMQDQTMAELTGNLAGDVPWQAQVAAADVLLLAKADQASETQRAAFARWARQWFPPKRWVGEVHQGELPAQALAPPAAPMLFSLPPIPRGHGHPVDAEGHAHTAHISTRTLQWADHPVSARAHRLLDRDACGWIWPNGVLCDPQRLALLCADGARWQAVERGKGVLRTQVEAWQLVQFWAGQFAQSACAWRQDQRLEIQLKPGVRADWAEWDAALAACMVRCPVA